MQSSGLGNLNKSDRECLHTGFRMLLCKDLSTQTSFSKPRMQRPVTVLESVQQRAAALLSRDPRQAGGTRE